MVFPGVRGKTLLLGAFLLWNGIGALALAELAAPGGGLPEIPLQGELRLTPRLLLQLALVRNADAIYSRLASEASSYLARAEQGTFEVVAYGGLRHEDRKRQRTAQELDLNNLLKNETLLDEQVNTVEMGARRRLGSGGELTLSYRLSGRENNLIKASPITKGNDTEYDGALALTFKQPLLRGFGSAAIEADRKIAELEWAITKQQYKQQILRTSSEALAAYWQLYRANESLRLRREALQKAVASQGDVQARIAGGRLPRLSGFESGSAEATHKAAVFRAEQGVSEAEAKIKTLLNLPGQRYAKLQLVAGVSPMEASRPVSTDEARLEQALQRWPSYRITELKRQQAQVRFDYAGNQKRPQLDLMASCSSSYLSYEAGQTSKKAFSNDFPDCYLGLNFEMPIEGNLRGTSQHEAQRVRMIQTEVETEAVRTSLANDLELRAQQLDRSIDEVVEHTKDVSMRGHLLDMERKQFGFGLSRLSQVLARENELNDSQDRLLDSQVRQELARVALQLSEGSLMDAYAVDWREN